MDDTNVFHIKNVEECWWAGLIRFFKPARIIRTYIPLLDTFTWYTRYLPVVDKFQSVVGEHRTFLASSDITCP